MANTWTFGAYAVPLNDSPQYSSVWPEDQEDNYIKVTPVGATGTASTVAQLVNTPSIQATLVGYCTAATKAQIEALRRTVFVITSPFDAVGKSWLLTKARFVRWTPSWQMALSGADEHFWYTMELLGR